MKSKVLGLVAAALFLVLCGWLYSRQGVLRFASVEIENIEDQALVLAVKRKIAPFLGANLLTLSMSELQKSLQENPRIKKVVIRRKLPSTLILKVVERIPVAAYFEGAKPRVISDEGQPIEGLTVTQALPLWLRYTKTLAERQAMVSTWLAELRSDAPQYFGRITEFEWVENRGLVLTVQSTEQSTVEPDRTEVSQLKVDMGTEDFSLRWRRVQVVLDWMLEQRIHGERLIALADGQVVISGVKNLHNLKNELNLKEIVRRATPQSDTRAQAR